MNTIKIFLILLITVVIASVARYFYFQNQKSSTVALNQPVTSSKWVTYTSKNLGVQFSYPKDYPTAYPKVPSGISESSNQIRLLHLMGYAFEIDKIDTNQSLDDWSKSQTNYTQSKTTFNGLPAYYFKDKFVAQVPMDFYAVKTANSIYQVYFETEGTEAIQCSECDSEHLKLYRDYAEKFRSSDKLVLDRILSSFKFLDSSNNTTGNTVNYDKAVKILQAVPEIQIIENAVIKNGRNTSFSSAGGENGDIVTVLLFEGGFPDQHTTRIDTFMVNVKTNEIQVYDATSVPNKNLSLEEWKKTVKDRFQ